LRMVCDADSGGVARNVEPFVVFGVFFAHGVLLLFKWGQIKFIEG
jgi:hypothetical protein